MWFKFQGTDRNRPESWRVVFKMDGKEIIILTKIINENDKQKRAYDRTLINTKISGSSSKKTLISFKALLSIRSKAFLKSMKSVKTLLFFSKTMRHFSLIVCNAVSHLWFARKQCWAVVKRLLAVTDCVIWC